MQSPPSGGHNKTVLSGSSAPICVLSQKVVRLIYIDEAGIDDRAPVVVLAGVIVEDKQWRSIERDIDDLILAQVPQSLRENWEFHAYELWCDKDSKLRKAGMTRDQRLQLLTDFLKIALKHRLPIICAIATKAKVSAIVPKYKRDDFVSIGFWACASVANRWLADHAPPDVGMLIADNADGATRRIKAFRYYRKLSALPMRNLVETVHFADSRDTWGLQLADCCAYVIKRQETSKADVKPFYDLIAEAIYDGWKFP